MNRHVIKGRGPNRGMYLTYGRLVGLPMSPYGWTPRQRMAARWEDPRYGWSKHSSILAADHNGYFVKLVAPAAIVARVGELNAFIASHADPSERLPCHWFGADFHDAGENFCRGCAEKIVDEKFAADPERFAELFGDDHEDAEERYRAAIDGGWSIEHDSPPSCETCGAALSGTLTDYGADEEIAALTGEIAPAFDDAHGWRALDEATMNIADDDPRWRAIARVVDAAKDAERKAKAVAT